MRQLLPVPGQRELSDDDLLSLYAPPLDRAPASRTWVRFNFIASADGAASLQGRCGGLGTDGDRRLFALLRRPADAILVGAQTVRTEGYEGYLVDPASRAWRLEHGLVPHPLVAVVSGSLNLDPSSDFFTKAPARPLLLTTTSAPAAARRDLSEGADIVDCGTTTVDPTAVRGALAHRGCRLVNAEGGPAVFSTFTNADQVDELCLTISPTVVGSEEPRISGSPQATEQQGNRCPVGLRLVSALEEESALFLRYLPNE